MLRKIAAALLCALFIACFILAGFSAIYFILPSRKAQASIELAESVSDPSTEEVVETAEQETEDQQDFPTYVADVYNFLPLRQTPDMNNHNGQIDLPPMTHMKVLEDVEGSQGDIFSRVTVTSGQYEGNQGYVKREYITPLGQPTKRAGHTQ